jgi:hypothetical protein
VDLQCTPLADSFINSNKARMTLPLPKKVAKTTTKRKTTSSAAAAPKKTSNKKAKKSTSKKPSKETKKKAETNRSKPRNRQKKTVSQSQIADEVIELLDDTDQEVDANEDSFVEEVNVRKGLPSSRNYDDSDSEFEFDG